MKKFVEKLICIYIVLQINLLTICSELINFDETSYTTPEVVKEAGYPFEKHNVTSTTGYITTLHRIPHAPNKNHNATEGGKGNSNRSVVVLVHGFAQSSVHWLLLGTNFSLGFILVDEGYDVWMWNLRGNGYSNDHTTYKTSDKEYWEFSFHETGDEDMPKVIDYIVNTTGKPKIYFIGYNLGCTHLLTGLSLHPEYSSKIRLFVGMAPLAYMSHATSPWMSVAQLPATAIFYETIKATLGVTTYPPSEKEIPVWQKFYKNFCAPKGIRIEKLCNHLIYLGFGKDFQGLANNKSTAQRNTTTPSLISFKAMIHAAQIASSNRFQRYDFRLKNMEKYALFRPPLYKIHKLSCPVALIAADSDTVISTQDVKHLSDGLVNVVEQYNVQSAFFNHSDYVSSPRAKELVYKKILDMISNCESSETACPQLTDDD